MDNSTSADRLLVFSNIKTFTSSDVSNANIKISKASCHVRREGLVLVVMFLSANTEFHNLIGNTALTTAAQVILMTRAMF